MAIHTYEELERLISESGRPYDMDKIQRAYLVANKAHEGQSRLSGESYISHPINVAAILLDLGLDTDSVCAALLHDVVEDTDIKLDTIKTDFGNDVAVLVDGVTKLGKITFSS
ncbi:MAG: HD domain-containing protein, partial [Oscillospiraceae bacterium]